MPPSIKDYIKRIANTTIDTSTLRNQGAPNVVRTACDFLVNDLDLASFVGDQLHFARQLDFQTKTLASAFPGQAKGNWGAARKALNLFLEECYYHRFVCDAYQLDQIEKFLEVPLDSQIADYLSTRAKTLGETLPGWKGIKHLNPLMSEAYQNFALKVAAQMGDSFFRVHLDILVWGRNPDSEED